MHKRVRLWSMNKFYAVVFSCKLSIATLEEPSFFSFNRKYLN